MFKGVDFKEAVLYFFIVGIAIFFISYSIFFAVNFPFQDDFLLIQFVEGVTKPNVSFSSFISELFSTQNDHKAVIPRLIALSNYALTGSLNYKFFILLTNLNIGFIYFFFYQEFKKLNLKLSYFIPVGLVLMQPLYYEISSWALSGMQQTFSTVFVILAIVAARKNSQKGMYFAILFCFLATFTHGNGIFSFPAVLCYYFFTSDRKKMVLIAMCMAIAFLLYMSNYESGQAAGLPKSLILPVTSFFGFIGSSIVSFSNSVIYSVIFGGVIVSYIVLLVVKRIQLLWKCEVKDNQGNVGLLSVMVYIICMSLVIAVVRTSVGGGVSSRFQLYAAMSTAIFYLLLLEKGYLLKRTTSMLVIALSVFYFFYSYYRFTSAIFEKKVAYKSDVFNWKYNRSMFSVEKTIVNNASFYLLPAYERGIFATDEPIVSLVELENEFKVKHNNIISKGTFIEDWNIKRLGNNEKNDLTLTYFNMYNNQYPTDNNNFTEIYLILRNEGTGKVYLHEAMPKVEARKVILTQGKYYNNGFNLSFRNDDLENGEYDLMILRVKFDGSKTYFNVSQRVIVHDERLRIVTPNL